jgi:hypothetical protein
MSNDHEMKLTTPTDTQNISNINHKTYIHNALSYKNKTVKHPPIIHYKLWSIRLRNNKNMLL